MPLTARKLFELAREVETRIASLYEDLSGHLAVGSEEAKFFAQMAAQEHMHAAWVDEMAASLAEDIEIDSIEEEEFRHILNTIEDVHDEVVTDTIDVCGALEIIHHLESSTAEDFYLHFPENIPGIPEKMIQRLAKSCHDHVTAILNFQKDFACRYPRAGTPEN